MYLDLHGPHLRIYVFILCILIFMDLIYASSYHHVYIIAMYTLSPCIVYNIPCMFCIVILLLSKYDICKSFPDNMSPQEFQAEITFQCLAIQPHYV